MSTSINEEQQYISLNSTGSNNSSANLPSMSKDKYMTTYKNFLQWKKCCGPRVECRGYSDNSAHRIFPDFEMAVQELQGKSLGEKHRHYNKLVKEALKNNKELLAEDFNAADNDVNNLIKIDVASKTRNVEYLLKVIQCEDMLYVSRAIKQSTWLITDRQYSHIINPHYLNTQLFPKMMSKACAKLLLKIRLHLKDEERVDDFYNFIKEKDIQAAFRWLPQCSQPLAEQEVKKYFVEMNYNQNKHIFKRLCEKSITFLEICIKDCDYPCSKLQSTMFLLNTNTEKYLDIVESYSYYRVPKFGPNSTSIMMKSCPQRILNKFEIYAEHIDLSTFVRHMKTEEIKDFIYKLSEKKDMQSWMKYDNLKYFVKYFPKEDRFDLVKNFFIEKSKKENEETMKSKEDFSKCSIKCSDSLPLSSLKSIYRWYRYAPFEVAFANLTKLIRAESEPTERISMFGVLLSCAGRNTLHVQTVLQYYSDHHINEPFKYKIEFVNTLLAKTDTYRFNEIVWNTLNNIFHSMEVYIGSENSVQSCIEAIILYKLLHNETVPEIIENKFKFQSMKTVQTKLTVEEKEKVFDYLYKFLEKKVNSLNIKNEIELTETVKLLGDGMILLTDWKKDLVDYSRFLEKIKEVHKLIIANSWKSSLSTLYLNNKSWRKIMFKESLVLAPSNKTCYNALKHDPELMMHNKSAIEELRRDDKVSLRRILRALRIYWPQTLAAEWITWYLDQLDKSGGCKALIRGLCTLAPQQKVLDIVKKYAPTKFKINWSEDDEHLLSLRKHLARNMYLSRPLLPPDVVLLYAKGDYLQFVLPSLNAILHNMSTVQTREHISKLLVAPVSVQKHGIRFAFAKLEAEELKMVFHDIWENATNPSIRAVLFTQTYDLLCRQTKPTTIEEIWELMSIFIDSLSTDENRIIYETLVKYDQVPKQVRGKFFMKSFKFLKSLQPHKLKDAVNDVEDLTNSMHDIIELLDPEFVADILLKYDEKKFCTERYKYTELMASYLLCAKDAKSQSERYKKVLLPMLQRGFLIKDVESNEPYWFIKNFVDLLQGLSLYFQTFVFEKKMVFPAKVFSDIQDELNRLPSEKYYQTQTMWKLYTTFVRLLEEHKDTLATIDAEPSAYEEAKKKADPYYYFNPKGEKKWNEVYLQAIPKFSKICLENLREDVKKYFPSILWIFAKSLKIAFFNINEQVYLKCLKSLLEDEEFIPMYMVVLENSKFDYDEDDSLNYINEIREKVFSNPSAEIKFYYYTKYSRHDIGDSC